MKIIYETECCSRCSGSGHYSYNQMTGTRCFKCNGSGTQLTKRGASTKDLALSLTEIKGVEIKVGDTMRFGNNGQITVESIQVTERESMNKRLNAAGEIPKRSIVTVTGPKFEREFYGDSNYKKFLTEDQICELRVYQDSLTKAGKPRKVRA